MATSAVHICPDHARQVIMEFLEPFVESGQMDQVFQRFVEQLTPYVVAAAEQAIRRQCSGQNAEIVLRQLRQFLFRLLTLLESSSLPHDSGAFLQACVDLKDWICLIDHRPADLAQQGGAA